MQSLKEGAHKVLRKDRTSSDLLKSKILKRVRMIKFNSTSSARAIFFIKKQHFALVQSAGSDVFMFNFYATKINTVTTAAKTNVMQYLSRNAPT